MNTRHKSHGRVAWGLKPTLALGLALWSLLLASCGDDEAEERARRLREAGRRIVAQAGDSVFTVARLQAWLAAQPDSLGRTEIEDWLHGWVEDQVLAQEALRQGLDSSAAVQEDLRRIRLRYLRGRWEEQSLIEPLDVSQLELRTWFRGNQERLAIPERQINLAWYVGSDSTVLASLIPSLQRGPVAEARLEKLRIREGRTGMITWAEADPRHVGTLFRLKYMKTTPVLRRSGGFVVYQLVGQRPAGWTPDPDQDEAELRETMLRDLRWKRLSSRQQTLRDEAAWKVDLQPLMEAEGGLPKARN